MSEMDTVPTDSHHTGETPVDDDELVFRFVDPEHVRRDGDKLTVKSTAFNDRKLRPSVDRANLCSDNPNFSMRGSLGGVLVLRVGDIREREGVLSLGDPPLEYLVDVVPRPEPDNRAHAQVETRPDLPSKSSFNRVKERLQRLANAEIMAGRGWALGPKLE